MGIELDPGFNLPGYKPLSIACDVETMVALRESEHRSEFFAALIRLAAAGHNVAFVARRETSLPMIGFFEKITAQDIRDVRVAAGINVAVLTQIPDDFYRARTVEEWDAIFPGGSADVVFARTAAGWGPFRLCIFPGDHKTSQAFVYFTEAANDDPSRDFRVEIFNTMSARNLTGFSRGPEAGKPFNPPPPGPE